MLTEGQIIDGKYRVLKKIAEGGMSTVYLVRHQMLGEYRAIKEICRKDCVFYESYRQNLLREIHILKSLDHPNLPKIMDVIVAKESLFIVMEYIQGSTLKELLKKNGPFEAKQVIEWGKQICAVLQYLHTRTPPIIYRDLKPSNLMLKADGRIIFIDFGTAKEYRARGNHTEVLSFGTLGYAAPEQYERNGKTDERTDIFCFGVTMYCLMTGKKPASMVSDLYWIKEEEFRGFLSMKRILSKCTRKNPWDRYQSCVELQKALEYCEKEINQRENKEKRKVAVGIFIGGAVLTGMLLCGGIYGKKYFLKQSALEYVRQAEKTLDENYRRSSYEIALKMVPEAGEIYESLDRTYVKMNHFTMENAADLMSILEGAGKKIGKPVLEILRRKNSDAYCEFCYNVGIGYFYYMDSVEGKKEALDWFRDVCHAKSKNFSSEKKERAFLYWKIAEYYRTFVTAGEDKSGEKKMGGYADFFRILCQLNQVNLKKDSSESEAAAAYLISVEVAIEIGNFSAQFIQEGKIPYKNLLEELDKIKKEKDLTSKAQGEILDRGEQEQRIELLKNFREKEEIEKLERLVMDARGKILSAVIGKN